MGKPRNTQKYPTYPEIPEIPGNTRKKKRYPEIPDRIFRHSYPTRTRPATRYFVQYPTRPDTEKPYPLGTDLVHIGFWSGIGQNVQKNGNIWPKMTKNADFGPNLAIFGPKSLIFM